MLSLRAKKSTQWVVTVLTRAGIPLRTREEAIAISSKTRAETRALLERRIVEFPRGSTGRRRRPSREDHASPS